MVCMWRHDGHVGGQEQWDFSLLGVHCHFYANFVNKFSFVLSINTAAKKTTYCPAFLISKGLDIRRRVKIKDKNERSFDLVMTPLSSSDIDIDIGFSSITPNLIMASWRHWNVVRFYRLFSLSSGGSLPFLCKLCQQIFFCFVHQHDGDANHL